MGRGWDRDRIQACSAAAAEIRPMPPFPAFPHTNLASPMNHPWPTSPSTLFVPTQAESMGAWRFWPFAPVALMSLTAVQCLWRVCLWTCQIGKYFLCGQWGQNKVTTFFRTFFRMICYSSLPIQLKLHCDAIFHSLPIHTLTFQSNGFQTVLLEAPGFCRYCSIRRSVMVHTLFWKELSLWCAASWEYRSCFGSWVCPLNSLQCA